VRRYFHPCLAGRALLVQISDAPINEKKIEKDARHQLCFAQPFTERLRSAQILFQLASRQWIYHK